VLWLRFAAPAAFLFFMNTILESAFTPTKGGSVDASADLWLLLAWALAVLAVLGLVWCSNRAMARLDVWFDELQKEPWQ